MKIGILSDLHLGYRQYGSVDREEDFYQQFHKCCDKLNEKNVDMVIIAGDIFDKPNPSPRSMHEYGKGIKSLGAKIIVAIKGNHTMLLRDNHYSVDEFFFDEKAIGNYFLLDDDSISFENVRVDGITYRPDSRIDGFLYEQQEIADEDDPCDFRILVTHQAYQEHSGFFGVELSLNDLNTDPYDLIINGHIHSHQISVLSDDTIFLQPGSIERMNTAEALDEEKNGKGVWIYDTDNDTLTFCDIECERKFLQGDINIASERQLTIVFDILNKKLDALDSVKPVISFNYHDFINKPHIIRDEIAKSSKKSLINNSNIINETEKEISVEFSDGEIPTVLEMLNMIDTDFSKDEKKLASDIHEFCKDGKDISGLLESYRKRHFNNKPKKIDIEDIMKEIEEYEKYFESL